MKSVQPSIIPNYKMGAFYRFFSWCSGARLYLLTSCPTDYNKFFGIGMIVFLTGLMASITGYFASYMIFESHLISVGFGVLWGILIFFLDWFIVASLKKEEKFLPEFLFSIPRIILAILLAVVISTPLELKLFEKEINAVLVGLKTESAIKHNELVDKEFAEIEKLKNENKKLRTEFKNKETQRNSLFEMIIKEAEGRSPTGVVGKGPVYREKKAEFDRLNKKLDIIKKDNDIQIKINNQKIKELDFQKKEKISNSKQDIQKADGLLARLEAMSLLKERSKTVSLASWFIFILFVLIEAAPILVKLLSRRGPYDELIDKEEYEKQIEYKKQKVKAKILANNYLELLKQKDELQIEAEKRNNKSLIKQIEVAKEDINKKVVEKWKEKELENAVDLTNFDDDDLQKENTEEFVKDQDINKNEN